MIERTLERAKYRRGYKAEITARISCSNGTKMRVSCIVATTAESWKEAQNEIKSNVALFIKRSLESGFEVKDVKFR